jgi:chromosome segregation ATPase
VIGLQATALLRSENSVDELTENIADRDRKLETISSELERVKSRHESIIEDLRDKNKDLNGMLTEYRERLSTAHANHEKFVKRVEDEYLTKMRGAEEKKEQIERERMTLLRKESSLVQEMDELRAEVREKDAIVEVCDPSVERDSSS